ncbi:Carboxylesterase [Rhexocercosporidium sp. MPI-PUGE-AT-0058]|nr:Carboxylesterase [Rhexocercosporidium sp. MPI-PUGE-AT-0058]
MNYYTHKHSFGDAKGIARGADQDVVQFRGIPYAHFPARFRQSTLANDFASATYDATNLGPECPQLLLPYPAFWDEAAPPDVPNTPSPLQDEFKCLNLSVTVPKSALEGQKKDLPVLLFIHGGGFMGGSHIVKVAGREIYDPTNLVRASIGLKKPIIVVTINYRVGILGFASCKELKEFNAANDEPFGNYGLHDQRQALDWVEKYIGAFGGDHDKVTIYGTSAGGASCHYQCVSKERKFKRAILSSGTLIGIGPVAVETLQSNFEDVAGRLGYKAEDGGIVKFVQSKPVEELLPCAPANSGGAARPTIDGDWTTGHELERLPSVSNPPDIMVGSCVYEQELTDMMIGGRDPNDKQTIQEKLEVAKLVLASNGLLKTTNFFLNPTLLAAYNIDTSSKTPETNAISHKGLAELLADFLFRASAVQTALKYPGDAFLYDFQSTNPFLGARQSYKQANHGVNDLFVFNVAEDQVPAEDRANWAASAKQTQELWIRFVNGEKPWGAIDAGKKGPAFTFADGAKGGEKETIKLAVGDEHWKRWDMILNLDG